MSARWYVLHVYSGSEKKVAESIKEQAVLKKMEDKILDVIVPTEDVVEVRKGSKVNTERDRKSTRLNSSHDRQSRMPSSA